MSQMADIAGKIEAYEALRDEAERMTEQLAELKRRRDAAESEVIAAILDAQEGVGGEMRVTCNGRNYSVSTKSYYSIPKASREEAFEELRALGMGDLIVEKVDERTLTRELNEIFTEHGCQFPEEYGPLFGILTQYDKASLSRRKA